MSRAVEQLRAELNEPLASINPAALHEAGAEVLAWLVDHLARLPDQPVGRSATRAEMEALLRQEPPEAEADFSEVFAELRQKVLPYAMRLNHPRFLAFIPSAPTFVSALADFLCAGTNFFCGVWIEAAGPAE